MMQWYEFGVMSSKWKLKTDDEDIAKLCMALHMATTAPIAIYSPIHTAFKPIDALDKHVKDMDDKIFQSKVRTCMKTIKEVKLK